MQNPRVSTLAEDRPPAYSSEIPRTPGYYVYRLWAEDICLYVGRVGDSGPRLPRPRFRNHRRTKPWWGQVTRIEVAQLPDHPAMVTEEFRQIYLLQPPHNVHGRTCEHDLSQPGAINAVGRCLKCTKRYQAGPGAKATQQAYEIQRKPEKRLYDRARQPLHNAAKRRRRRAPSRDQGSLW